MSQSRGTGWGKGVLYLMLGWFRIWGILWEFGEDLGLGMPLGPCAWLVIARPKNPLVERGQGETPFPGRVRERGEVS